MVLVEPERPHLALGEKAPPPAAGLGLRGIASSSGTVDTIGGRPVPPAVVPEAGSVFAATGTTTDCSNFAQLITTGSQRVEGLPHTTSELTFPQPLVLGPGDCLVVAGGNNTDITVVGYLLP